MHLHRHFWSLSGTADDLGASGLPAAAADISRGPRPLPGSLFPGRTHPVPHQRGSTCAPVTGSQVGLDSWADLPPLLNAIIAWTHL